MTGGLDCLQVIMIISYLKTYNYLHKEKLTSEFNEPT